ncbi:MAG TPA: TIGR03667 family PPOX class F420-dependent oxidoreductase [Actinospica sp.]|jgi:PPOX class probable F420-dependent enzyme|nr:TIGR03667 family PPOX class F420-dependent oxidoreductase [Actinospica sp.]
MNGLDFTAHLEPEDRERAEGRLRSNLMAWLTTVRADGQPVTVPVWFLLRADGDILFYSKPGTAKLRNLAANPRVSLALDVCDLGRNVVRLEGAARLAAEHEVPAANENPEYLLKYTERIAALFGAPEKFAALFTVPVLMTASKAHV